MKLHFVLLIASLSFFAFMCEKSDPVVGSNKDVEISGLVFTLDRSNISGATMYANGTVRNNGSGQVNSPWLVEGQFYTDSTYTMKLGGSNVQINVPLESGQGTIWSLSFYSNQGNIPTYPKFKVGNLRGIYEK